MNFFLQLNVNVKSIQSVPESLKTEMWTWSLTCIVIPVKTEYNFIISLASCMLTYVKWHFIYSVCFIYFYKWLKSQTIFCDKSTLCTTYSCTEYGTFL